MREIIYIERFLKFLEDVPHVLCCEEFVDEKLYIFSALALTVAPGAFFISLS